VRVQLAASAAASAPTESPRPARRTGGAVAGNELEGKQICKTVLLAGKVYHIILLWV
jgi:hypothetical protein